MLTSNTHGVSFHKSQMRMQVDFFRANKAHHLLTCSLVDNMLDFFSGANKI